MHHLKHPRCCSPILTEGLDNGERHARRVTTLFQTRCADHRDGIGVGMSGFQGGCRSVKRGCSLYATSEVDDVFCLCLYLIVLLRSKTLKSPSSVDYVPSLVSRSPHHCYPHCCWLVNVLSTFFKCCALVISLIAPRSTAAMPGALQRSQEREASQQRRIEELERKSTS